MADQSSMIRDRRMRPDKTEVYRGVVGRNVVTLHSTGQAWVTRQDGTLVLYHDGHCGFGCMPRG
jgi:hypothetical protein